LQKISVVKIRKEIKVGGVFVLATAILIWGLMYLKGLELLKTSRTFYAQYENVNGLVSANPVIIKGMQVGQVKKVYFNPKDPTRIIVELYILGDYPITKNTVAKIVRASLLGAHQVELIIGDSKEMAQDNDTLTAGLEEAFGEAQLMPLKTKAENLISSLDSIAIIVKKVLNEDTRENLQLSIKHIKETLANLSGITHSLDTLVGSEKKNLAGIIRNMESISANLRNNNDKISNVISNFSAISDSLAKARIPMTISRVNSAVSNLDSVLVKINSGQGSVGQLVNNEQLYKEIEKAARDLNLLLEDIKANPKKYLKFSVF
jgi:phospholipid/cholesterol/gamma-HCH transport system substrate-binding protein